MKMPNVKANLNEYQKEIGVKLGGDPLQKLNRISAETVKVEEKKMHNYDELREARNFLPEKEFYKIVKKDRI